MTNLSATNTTWRNVKSPDFGQPDPAARMTRDATNPNLYRISFTPRTYYPVPANETILRLGMFFKNGNGSVVGRAADGGDIFVDVYPGGPAVRIIAPAGSGANPQFVPANVAIPVTGESAQPANLVLTLNGTTIAQATNATTLSGSATPTQPGRNVLKLTAGTGATAIADSVILVVRPAVTVAALPAGAKEGVTYLPGGTSVILALTAPNKQFAYALGEFNNFQPTDAAYLNKTPDGTTWWVQLNGLTPGREYAYQYLVDGNLRVADPYTEKVLDPSNDRFIPAVTYPGLRYPAGQTGLMATFQTNQTPYQWQVGSFTRPAKTNLVIYELHLRDFIARHDYQTLRDTLGYLQRLGVNCVELMPVNEFEGNDSWGYNPSFYFATDKYYGTKDNLKRFVDEAHRRGMAVVLDMVLNHSCGQSPMYQLYSDGGGATADNPWFNRVATHPFNVCNDFNHESPYTRRFSKNVMDFWVNEYRVDGYRFDLSKGFTQVNSGNNVGQWGNYDQSRINIWLDYYNRMQTNQAGTYAILEHFADNSEETVLANAGMMLWGNLHGAYSAGATGNFRSANFSSAYASTRLAAARTGGLHGEPRRRAQHGRCPHRGPEQRGRLRHPQSRHGPGPHGDERRLLFHHSRPQNGVGVWRIGLRREHQHQRPHRGQAHPLELLPGSAPPQAARRVRQLGRPQATPSLCHRHLQQPREQPGQNPAPERPHPEHDRGGQLRPSPPRREPRVSARRPLVQLPHRRQHHRGQPHRPAAAGPRPIRRVPRPPPAAGGTGHRARARQCF